MPLARIITNAVDESLELTLQLRARGFRVETVAPGKIPTTPADLEVRLDECAPEEIVARAADSDASDNLWVFVAPGALDERARPMRVISLAPPTHPARSSEAEAIDQPAKVMAAEAVLFPSPEDDPILAELKDDVILSEHETATLHEVASATAKFETTVSVDSAPASNPIKTASEPHPAQLPEKAKSDSGVTVSKAQAAGAAAGTFSIPRVPDPPPFKVIPSKDVQPKGRPAVYKITFQTGPSFWRAAWVSGALVVLLGVLALVLQMKPHLPANVAKPASAQSYPAFSSPQAPDTKLPAANPERLSSPAMDASASRVETPAAQLSSAKTPNGSGHKAVGADDIIAEDTVVFYDRPHRPGTSKIAAQAKTRKYSDQN